MISFGIHINISLNRNGCHEIPSFRADQTSEHFSQFATQLGQIDALIAIAVRL